MDYERIKRDVTCRTLYHDWWESGSIIPLPVVLVQVGVWGVKVKNDWAYEPGSD